MKSISFLTLLFFVVIIYLTAGVIGCDQDEYPTPQDTIYADPEFLEWWWCEEGSWWVYKRTDDTTQVMYDTAKAIQKAIVITFEPRYSASAIATYNLHLKHSSQYFKQRGSLNDQNLNTSGTDATGLKSNSHANTSEPIDYFSFKWILNWPLQFEFNIPDANRVTLLDSNRLANPLLNRPTLHYTTPTMNGEVWISKNIGIVKYKFGYDSSVWELVDYHIVQK